jgi:hypothetical protein
LRRVGKSKKDQALLAEIGQNVASLIEKKGYKSPYDFWIKKGEGEFSRAALAHIIAGRMDAKITTISALARLLNVSLNEILGL